MSKSLRKKMWSARQRVAGSTDERFHVGEIASELSSAEGRQLILGPRPAAIEALGARHIAGVLQLAGVDTEVAIRRLQQRLDLVERQPLRGGKGAHDAEPEAMVDEVERRRLSGHGPPAAPPSGSDGRRWPLGSRPSSGARI